MMLKRVRVLFAMVMLVGWVLSVEGVNAGINPQPNPIPQYQIPDTSVDNLLSLLDQAYTGHQKPPIVLVHGWQGANLGLACQRHDSTYVDENWAYVDEELGSGVANLEEPVGSGQTRVRNGLGFHVEIARLYSGGATSATGPSDPNYHCSPVAEENVPNLIEAIDDALTATGQDKVILIAHSMGGLVSRAYLEGSGYRDHVVALFT
ncbi:MAG: alpha/beta fold hydrolase, partial [Methylococcales bacterium]|nr:alpha/beta fold hydrolase [Methylococcales bacterium]